MDNLEGLSTEQRTELLNRLNNALEVKNCVNGVTHDVNNFLGAILAYAELIQLDSNLEEESDRMLNQIIDGISECSALLTSLTEIARKEKPVAMASELSDVIDEALKLRLYELKRARISVDTQYDKNIPFIVVDRPKLKLAILTIISNAIEAMNGAKDRRIRIKMIDSDDTIEIHLWNSGPVIGEDEREQMFNPSFTTNGNGNVGWGLHTAKNVALLHNGTLSYDEKKGFVMCIPKENNHV